MLLPGVRRIFLVSAVALAMVAQDDPPPEQSTVGAVYDRGIMTPTNQVLALRGQRISFSNRPVDLAVSPARDRVALILSNGARLYSASGQLIRTLPLGGNSIMGAAFSPDGGKLAVTQNRAYADQGVAIGPVDASAAPVWLPVADSQPNPVPTGIAFDPAGKILYVAMSRHNLVARVDLNSGAVTGTVDVGVAPAGLVCTKDRLFVANWGGRVPAKGESVAYTSHVSILTDARGTAANGTVSVIDLGTFKAITEIPVGLHPSTIALSPVGGVAAVANANSDSISLIDTVALQVIDTLPISAVPGGFSGASPASVAFDRSGGRLYAACGGNNAVAVFEEAGGVSRSPRAAAAGQREAVRPPIRRAASGYRFRGFLATDWYPFAVGVVGEGDAPDNIFVANGKGIGSRAGDGGGNYRSAAITGTMNIIPAAAAGDDARVLAANHPFASAAPRAGSPTDLGSLGIQHAFLIIKENRTYDQVLGDLGAGNGAPKLALYGANVTPNQHALASQFVVLDNFYASGTVSADGHQWLTQAMTTDYVERAGTSRSDQFNGDDALAFASSGFLWTNALEHGLTVRIFGEMTKAAAGYPNSWREYYSQVSAPQLTLPLQTVSSIPAASPLVEPNYPGWALNVPDVMRARLFIERLAQYQQTGDLPNLVVIYLPCDHTDGTVAGSPTPAAMVADNDLATGRIVEAIAKSSYWPTSAIFITEDDAQDGVDHVDGHRTLCFVVSPYARRGVVDSTQYNHTSILRTIEDLLGLPPLNKFDGAALPMRSVFATQRNPAGFAALPNNIPLDSFNPAPAALRGPARRAALDSAKMDFSRPDAAPEEKLNRILWHVARGWNTSYPRIPHGPNCKRDSD